MNITDQYVINRYGAPVAIRFANAKSKGELVRVLGAYLIRLNALNIQSLNLTKVLRAGNGEVYTTCGLNASEILSRVYGNKLDDNLYIRTMSYKNGIFRFSHTDEVIVGPEQYRYFQHAYSYVYPYGIDIYSSIYARVHEQIDQDKRLLKLEANIWAVNGT